MKKVLIILMSTLALAAVSAGSGMAACPVTGCGGTGGTGTTTQTFDLTVAAPSRGTITGTSINCGAAGSDCTSSQTYTYDCIEFECTRTPEDDQVFTLAWSGPAGFGATWSGCETVTAGQCNVLMDADRDASAAVGDVADPTVAITGPADEVGNSVVLSATAADNDGVKRVDFFVDGALRGSDTVPPYQYNDTTNYAHGENHTATARAIDHSDRSSALSAGREFTVDRQINLTLGSTPSQGGYTNAASPSLGFTTDDDVAAGGKLCRVAGVGVFASCSSPFAPALGEGLAALEVKVTDNVGNTKTLARSFTVDRTVPAAAFTDGPGEGAEVSTTSVEISFEASDTSPLARACKVDGGGFGACSSATSHTLSGLAVGSHSLTVRVTDAAGNVKTITRSFAVKAPPTGTNTSTNTNTGTGTAGPTGPTGSTGPAPGGKIDAKVNTFWRLFGKKTQVGTLTVSNAPVGSKVTVTCKGKGCKFKRLALTVTGAKLPLAKRFKKKRLAANTVITITISKEGMIAKTFRYKLRAGKFPKLTLS